MDIDVVSEDHNVMLHRLSILHTYLRTFDTYGFVKVLGLFSVNILAEM